MSEDRNMILAVVISFLILFGFQYFTDQTRLANLQENQKTEQIYENNVRSDSDKEILPRNQALALTKRIPIRTSNLSGTINLKGALLDDLSLTQYKKTADPQSENVELLNPWQTERPYFIIPSWIEGSKATGTSFVSVSADVPNDFPNENTEWTVIQGDILAPEQPPLVLQWDNKKGLIFERTFSIDDLYMISVVDRVTNHSNQTVQLIQRTKIVRLPQEGTKISSVHEGGIGYLADNVQEISFDKLQDGKSVTLAAQQGWAGFTDKYWLTAFVVRDTHPVQVTWAKQNKAVQCQMDTSVFSLPAKQSLEYRNHFFAGAKVLKTLDHYKHNGVKKFDLAVDFGWFYFLTKPLFYLLQFLNSLLGNLALAIIFLTILSKLALYPFAKKSYLSMNRMKELQPKLEILKKRYGQDKLKMNEEMLRLYRKEKISPASGCLPLLVQMPIFFCLYKVFSVSIEMRHAPLCFWIKDLSAPDPTSIFNLFGLLPWTLPSFLQIGILPIIMGITMFVQQKLSPQPTDPTQAKVMYVLPLIFLFMFSSFPSGLVLYWTISNVLAIMQQYFFSKSAPVKQRHASI